MHLAFRKQLNSSTVMKRNAPTRRTGKIGMKVKSGCRTCKIRKVKCDEGRPACERCVSTGRICDGYGIWGGGGNFYGHRLPSMKMENSSIAPSIPILAEDTQDKLYFEWYRHRTSKKIPGLFVSSFWDKLLFQAILDESAVLHAVLALSSLHRSEVLTVDGQRPTTVEHDTFMLRSYNKAINHLRPHFLSGDKSSVRVALITCVIFVCLEFLRGHFKTAQAHLQNGLKVIGEIQTPFGFNDDRSSVLKPSHESIDAWILEVFSRLQVQVMLFQQNYPQPCLVLLDSRPEHTMRMFHTFNHAWMRIEQLLNQVFQLGKGGREYRDSHSPPSNPALLENQKHVQAELAQWLNTYAASRKELQNSQGQETEGFVFRLLCAYHIMANIMAGTYLCLDDEFVFDSYIGQFVTIVEYSTTNWKIRSLSGPFQAHPGQYMNMSRSVVDIGWIPPLYYTAVKCRVHRVRLHAIRLLETSFHREGIWDSKLTARVARKVMEIEERGFYKHIDTADDFDLSIIPESRDLTLETLPEFYRIHGIEIELPDGPRENLSLSYKQRRTSGDWKTSKHKFSILQQRWIDEEG